jgi:hypothetical protein
VVILQARKKYVVRDKRLVATHLITQKYEIMMYLLKKHRDWRDELD